MKPFVLVGKIAQIQAMLQAKEKDFRAYCSIKRGNVGILADCQFCECDCLRAKEAKM